MAERKIHISKAPPDVEAVATFVDQASSKGYRVAVAVTSQDGSAFVSATDGANTVNGSINGHTGKLTIHSSR